MKRSTVLVFLLLPLGGFAQEVIKDSIYSEALKEQRKIEIVLPDNYKPGSGEKYEATYVTDGEWNTKIVAQLQRFVQIQRMPPNVIVSLPNTYVNGENMRGRDFTPTKANDLRYEGGADKFITFLKDELIPYVEKKYPIKGLRTLYGGSLGGVFGLYTFFKEPFLFQSYMLADPAFWWDNKYLIKMAADSLPVLPNPGRTLLMTGREGEPFRYMMVKDMDSVFRAKAPATLHWKTLVYTGETHNSMLFKTVYDGFIYTYEGFARDAVKFHPMGGIVLKDKPFNLFCYPEEQLNNVRYTTDGTEPVLTSPAINRGVSPVTVSSQLVVKAFSVRDEYDKTTKGNFVIGETLRALPKLKNAKPGGLDTLAGHIDGFIEIKEPGYYLFALMHPDQETKVSIGDQQMFDFVPAKERDDVSYMLPLEKGFYPLHITYTAGKNAPEFRYIVPGKDEPEVIPAALQYHK